MRLKALVGLAAGAAARAGSLVAAAPAQAAPLPCWLAGRGRTASAGGYSGSSITWRLAADCLDRSNIKWPVVVTTLYSDYVTGDGTRSLTCPNSLSAQGRIEVR